MNELTEEPKPPQINKESQKPGLKAGRKSRSTKARKTPAGQGATHLRDAVNEAVDKASGRIAKALVRETCDGNASVVGIVVKLAGEPKAPRQTKKKKTKTSLYIQRLANEPEWEGPWADEDGKRDASKLPPSDFDLAPGDR